MKYIKFNCEVMRVSNKNNRWEVIYENDKNVFTEYYDAVIICSGKYHIPNYPSYNMDKYKGRVMHSVSYKNNVDLINKKLLIVGIGNSAMDIGVDVAQVTSECYISHRRKTLLSYRGTNEVPIDYLLVSRRLHGPNRIKHNIETYNIFSKELTEAFEQTGIPDNRGIRTLVKHKDLLIDLYKKKKIKIVGDIDRFEENCAILKNGEKIECDVVMFCTGYKLTYSFLEESLIPYYNKKTLGLYKHILHPTMDNLFFIGQIDHCGGNFFFCEMQALWTANFLLGRIKAPSKEARIKYFQDYYRTTFTNKGKEAFSYVDQVQYADEISKDVGFTPQSANDSEYETVYPRHFRKHKL